jgi:hypothetical protein
MKKITLLFVILLACILTKAQEIPVIAGETINNKKINLPVDLKGKYSLLCFASSTKAETDLQSWLDPVYQKFIAKSGIMDDMYDVNVFFIPVLTGTNFTFAGSMKKKFKENTQEDLQSHVIFCNEEGKNILAALQMDKSDAPHIFLLNKECKVVYRTTGGYTEEKFDHIDDLLEE